MDQYAEIMRLMDRNRELESTVAGLIAVVTEALSIAEREGHYSAAQQIRAVCREHNISLS